MLSKYATLEWDGDTPTNSNGITIGSKDLGNGDISDDHIRLFLDQPAKYVSDIRQFKFSLKVSLTHRLR